MQEPNSAWLVTFWGYVLFLLILERIAPAFASTKTEQMGRCRIGCNFSLGILNGVIVASLPSFNATAAALFAEQRNIGLLNAFSVPLIISIPAVIFVRTFAQYLFHVLEHKVCFFWEFHKLHHSDDNLDVSSGVRFHPFEVLLGSVFAVPFVILFGLPYDILLVFEFTIVFGSIFTHSNIRVPELVEQYATMIFVTPRLHRFHHSLDAEESNYNFGDIVIFWDRIFATFHDSREKRARPDKFGVVYVGNNAADILRQLVEPVDKILRF